MAGQVKGPEAVEVALANTLRANLPAALAVVTAAWGDGLALPNPQLVHPGFLAAIRESPTVIVASIDGQETADLAPTEGQQAHRLDVVAILRGDRQDLLDRQAKRYLVAIWEVIKANQMLDRSIPQLAGVMTTRYGRSASYPNKKVGMLEMQAAWEVVAHVIEQV